MLAQMRNAAKSWVAVGLIGLLIVSFAIWGVNDIFRGSPDTTVIKVGPVEIDAQNFRVELDRRLNQFRQQIPDFTLEQARQFGLVDQVAQEMADRAALRVRAEEYGIAVADRAVFNEIRNIEAFQGITGEFDRNTYLEILAANRLSVAGFEADVRGDLVRRQYLAPLDTAVPAPQGLAEAVFLQRNERRTFSYIVLREGQLEAQPEPTEEQLRAFYEENKNRFQTEERRTFSYILVRPEALIDDIPVSEQEMRDIYEVREERYRTPERRRYNILTFLTASEAEAAKERLEAGATFEELAAERDIPEEDYAPPPTAQAEMIDSRLAEGVFAIEETGTLHVLEGDLSTAVVRVEQIVPGTVRSFEDVREEIRRELALDQAVDRILDLREQISNGVFSGEPLRDLAARLELPLRTVSEVNRRGVPKGATEPSEDLPSEAAVLQTAFEMTTGALPELGDTRDNAVYVVSLEGVTPAGTQPFEEVRERVLSGYKSNRTDTMLKELAEDLTRSGNGGATLEALAERAGVSVEQTAAPVTRADATQILSQELLGDVFANQKGSFVFARASLGDIWVVARVDSIVRPDPEEAEVAIRGLRDRLRQDYLNESQQLYIETIRDAVGVEINQDAINFALEQGGTR